MNKRFLNKNINSSLLKQPLPENLLQKSRSRGQARSMKLVTDYKLERFNRIWPATASRSSKLDRIQKAEMQIVHEFVQKRLEMVHVQGIKQFADVVQFQAKDHRKQSLLKKNTNNVLSETTTYEQAKKKENKRLFLSCPIFLLRSEKKESQLRSITKELLEENVFLLSSIEQIRSMLASKRIERQSPSELRDRLLESRKIRFLYGGLSKRELQRSTKKAKQVLGNTANNLLIALESRLDVVLERCGFFSSIRLARQSVIHKRVQINGKTVNTPGYCLQPGDIIQVRSKYTSNRAARSPILIKSMKGMQPCKTEKLYEFELKHYKRPRTFQSLLQLECLFSSICLQTDKNRFCAAHDYMCPTLSKRSEFPKGNLLAQAQLSRYTKDLPHSEPRRGYPLCADTKVVHHSSQSSLRSISFPKSILQISPFQGSPLTDLQVKGLAWRTRAGLRRLHISERALLRLNTLVKTSELYLATQNKAHFSNLFVKKFVANPSLIKSTNFNANFSVKALGCMFKAEEITHLALHIQQIVQKKQKELLDMPTQRQNRYIGKVNENAHQQQGNAAFYFDNTLYHVYFYWLQLIKRLLPRDQDLCVRVNNVAKLHHVTCAFTAQEQLLKQDSPFAKNRILPSQFRKIKPLHLEVSYQSYSAIFLYPPQRVYLLSLVNVDLLVKV